MTDPKKVAADGKALSAQLDALWDPIGVYEGPPDEHAPPGEYESYVWRIYGHLRAGDDPDTLAEEFRRIQRDSMGLGVSGREHAVAVELIAWYRKRHQSA